LTLDSYDDGGNEGDFNGLEGKRKRKKSLRAAMKRLLAAGPNKRRKNDLAQFDEEIQKGQACAKARANESA